MCRSNLEEDRGLFVCDGGLGDELVGERVSSRKVDSDFRETQLEQFKLSKVFYSRSLAGKV